MRTMRASDVIVALTTAMQEHGKPEFIRSDNGSEFTATQVMQWLQGQVVGPSFIQPGHPWQNAYVESFHGKFRDECLNREWFRSSLEAEVVIEPWRQHYKLNDPTVRWVTRPQPRSLPNTMVEPATLSFRLASKNEAGQDGVTE